MLILTKQVLIGFLGTAWFVVILVVLYYLLAFDPSKDPYWTPGRDDLEAEDPGANSNSTFAPNVIDELVIKWSRLAGHWLFSRVLDSQRYHWLCKRLSRRLRWENAFRNVSNCDQLLSSRRAD